jgi:SAM-dependent methyltransferase
MSEHTYSGAANLEVMEEAVNYNDYLLSRVCVIGQPGDRVVDFGAGLGKFAKRMSELGFAVECIEPDEAQAARMSADGLVVHSGLEALPDSSVDYIYTLNVLEHIDDDAAVLRQFCRTLKPGGRLLIYVPAFYLLYSSMDRRVGHVRRYRRGNLREKVRSAGLTVIHDRYVDCMGFLASLLFKALGSNSGDISRSSLILYDRMIFPVSQAVDTLLGRWIGKNVLLTAQKRR